MTMPQMPNPYRATGETQQVLQDVAAERRRQMELGWTPEHDDAHHVSHLVNLAESRTMNYLDDGYDRPDRQKLLEGVALLVAAVEKLDREAAR